MGLVAALGAALASAGEENAEGPGAPVVVAASLAGKQGATAPHPLALAFDGPRGDGRGGAKGILVRTGDDSERLGTQWSFRYVRSADAFGLQVIHPSKGGQVILHIEQAGVGLSTPKAWTEVGYGGGDARGLELTDAHKDFFPLKEDEPRQFTSTLGPDSAWRLEIDGKLVATATVRGTSPVSFAIGEGQRFPASSGWGKLEFAAPEFPLRWKAGYAAILVEPLDAGTNVVTQLRFGPSVVKLDLAKNADF